MVNWRSPSVKYFFRESIAEGPECLCFLVFKSSKRQIKATALVLQPASYPPQGQTLYPTLAEHRGWAPGWPQRKAHPVKPRPLSRPHSLFPSRHLTSACTTVANPVQALKAHVTYCLHSPHTVTSSLTLVVLSVDSTAGCSQEQLTFCFGFFFFLLPKVYFLWLELQAFCLGSECPASSTLTRGVSRETWNGNHKSNRIRFQNFHTMIKAEGRKHVQMPLSYFIEK